jgi:hypothetical protein
MPSMAKWTAKISVIIQSGHGIFRILPGVAGRTVATELITMAMNVVRPPLTS